MINSFNVKLRIKDDSAKVQALKSLEALRVSVH